MRTLLLLRSSAVRTVSLRRVVTLTAASGLLSVGAAGCAGDLEREDEYKELAPKLGLNPNPRPPNNPPGAQPQTPPGGSATPPGGSATPPGGSATPPGGTATPPGTTATPSPPPPAGVQIPDECRGVPALFSSPLCGGACHGSAATDGMAAVPASLGVDLGTDEETLISRLLDVPAPAGSMCEGRLLIDTTNPEQSLLITKLSNPPPCGLIMPFGGLPISESDRQCIIDWTLAVAAGAR